MKGGGFFRGGGFELQKGGGGFISGRWFRITVGREEGGFISGMWFTINGGRRGG